MERGPATTNRWTKLHPRDDLAPCRPAVGELGEPGAARKELTSPRPERRQRATAAAEHEPQAVFSETLGDVATIDQTKLKQAESAATPDGEGAGVDASHDPAGNAQVDDDADPQTHADPAHTERPRGQEHQRRVISGLGPPGRRRLHVQHGLRTRRDPEPPRPEPQPRRGSARGPHARPSVERARESRPRDVDEQRPAAGVPDRDHCRGRAPERKAQWARAEPDSAAGRGTRKGCRDQTDGCRRQGTLHRPITV